MPYTDYFGQPLAVGDEIVYPQDSGTHRNCYLKAPILEIVPLVPHRDNKNYLMRQDQAHLSRVTQYPKISDPDKQFVVQIYKRNRWGDHQHKKFTIRFVENIIKAPV